MARMVYEADGTCVLWGMGVTQNTGVQLQRNFACYG